MNEEGEIPQIRLQRKVKRIELHEKKDKEINNSKGRRAILIIFFLTITLSIIFWLVGNFSNLFDNFFGPSTWTFTK